MNHIEHVRIPDELRIALGSVCERFPQIASIEEDDKGIKLTGLTKEEQLALDFLDVSGPVDEIIDNINMILADLEALGNSSRAFGDNHPFRRYKLLVRTFFYEFGRFEDAFAYYTLWLQRRKYISKEQRKSMRDDFYEAAKPMAKVRNICLHSNPDWGKHVTPEIAILKGLDLFGLQVADKNGEILRWEPHLEPQCTQMCAMIELATSEMRTTWNMHFADCAERLIRDDKLRPATRRYMPKNLVRSKVRSHHGKQPRIGGGA
jgi:hypothetical protein